jgi:dihydrolipoamide dehydrogenase
MEKAKTYDAVIIGSGAGMTAMEEALAGGASVALVDKGPLGGTCLNLGCFPSKLLIYPADRIVEIQNSGKLGIEAEIKSVDFKAIMTRMQNAILQERQDIRKSLKKLHNFDYYEGECHFIKEYTLQVNDQVVQGKKVFIAAGARPVVPPIKGLEKIEYLTNESILALKQRPESIVIIGGGYIGVEYAHFLGAMGTRVTIVEMTGRLLQGEEPDIAELIRKKMSQRMEILLNTQVLEFDRRGGSKVVAVKDVNSG